MADISNNNLSFVNLSYSISALPLFNIITLDGFAEEGIVWEDTEPAMVDVGADALSFSSQRPVVYTCTINLLPNSNSRIYLDKLIASSGIVFGKQLVNYAISLIARNDTTGFRTVYTKGSITSAQGGDSANRERQQNKVYKISFGECALLPI